MVNRIINFDKKELIMYIKNFHERLLALRNFTSTKTAKKEDQIKTKGRIIILHLIKLLIYPEDDSRNHWTKEIITQVAYISKHREISGPSKIVTAGRIRSLLENDNLSDIDDVDSRLIDAILDENKNLARKDVNISGYNLEELYVSLVTLMNQLEDYFNGIISIEDLYLRLLYSFQWRSNMSLEECDELMNRWKKFK